MVKFATHVNLQSIKNGGFIISLVSNIHLSFIGGQAFANRRNMMFNLTNGHRPEPTLYIVIQNENLSVANSSWSRFHKNFAVILQLTARQATPQFDDAGRGLWRVILIFHFLITWLPPQCANEKHSPSLDQFVLNKWLDVTGVHEERQTYKLKRYHQKPDIRQSRDTARRPYALTAES